MKKHSGYLLAFAFLLAVIFITWFLFFKIEIVTNNEKRLAGIFSILALGFSLFQFWITELNNNRRKLFDLRYAQFIEFTVMMDNLSRLIDKEMGSNNAVDIHGLVSNLLSEINQIGSSIKLNSDYLFPDLQNKPETKQIMVHLGNILKETDICRANIEKIDTEEHLAKVFLTSIENMNWHNKIREELRKVHNSKYGFYNTLRSYL